jgi:hypothetical protein
MLHNTGITAGVANTAALGVDGPQPAWLTLNQARERAFTGEIVFETDPEVHAYLDNGIVYYAERSSDASLGRRLLETGVVDVDQLERGTVRVGDVEHLGRLFDRDPSVDRDAVIVMAETATEQLVTELANRSTASVRATAYRHHPSGVHRWFVTQIEAAPMAHPASTIAHYDSTVIDGLPSLPFADNDAGELIIEWDVELGHPTELRADVFDLSLDFTEFTGNPKDDLGAGTEASDDMDESAIDDLYIETIDDLYIETTDDLYIETTDDLYIETTDGLYIETIDHVNVDAVDDLYVETADDLAAFDPEEETAEEFEFSVVWPDGSEVQAIRTVASFEELTGNDDGSADDVTDEQVTDVDQLFTPTDDGHLGFAMPPLALGDEQDLADADVHADVADAVRRAIAAIEQANVFTPEPLLPASASPWSEVAEVGVSDELAKPVMLDAPADGVGGFAPPTMAMRAEVLYGQTSEVPTVTRSSSPVETTPAVFAADPAEGDPGGGNERTSALRRLIGSLRRKDH